MTAIPVIDLSAPVDEVAKKIGEACQNTGFFTVVGHGIPSAVVAEAMNAAVNFFALPLEQKAKVKRPKPEQNRGFISQGSETLSRLSGAETPPDYKEVFTIGPEVADDPYYTAQEAYPNFAPNLWPSEPAEMRSALLDYWSQMHTLSGRILHACAIALGLDSDYFAMRTNRPISMFRVINYPPQKSAPVAGQLRAGVHTDLNLLTIITSNDALGGLEVKDRGGNWISPPVREDSFTVNIGDLMMRWTNDKWVSTPHRVVNPPAAVAAASHRISLAYFSQANYDTMIECLPTCLGDGPKYAPVTAGEYRTSRFAATAN